MESWGRRSRRRKRRWGRWKRRRRRRRRRRAGEVERRITGEEWAILALPEVDWSPFLT